MRMESASPLPAGRRHGIELRLVGPLEILRDGEALPLPPSRKLRALLAYLALAPQPVSRSRLSEIFWEIPNDPRGELRWCLSKLRLVLDQPGRKRVLATREAVALDLADAFVDVHALDAVPAGNAGALQEGLALVRGDFLEGLELERSPLFETWLLAQRRHFRDREAALLRALAETRAGTDPLPVLERWVARFPHDPEPHRLLLEALVRRGQIAAGHEHLATATRLLAAEGLDAAPLRQAFGARGSVSEPAAGSHARPDVPGQPAPESPPSPPHRAALAVMPFRAEGDDGSAAPLADGLTHDVITRLAKLRSLFIIARGSVFALAEQGLSPQEAGRQLAVEYVTSGTLRRQGGQVHVAVELAEVATARIVWAETFALGLDDTFGMLDEIGDRIVSALVGEIELAERNRAILKPPNGLDAWEAYHRGVWHMYRFTRADNGLAQDFFRRSVAMDPTFARAHAALSFTHWQNAFQRWEDFDVECAEAFATAGRAMIVDDHDPAAHWALGRAFWLRGQQEDSIAELEKAVTLSPNFALGHYALSFVTSQSGDPGAAIRSSDQSRRLSPFDPLLFGMLGTRALAHVRLGQYEEAAEWALRAAARPNAHATILAIAAHCLALAGRVEQGGQYAAALRANLPHYRADDFLATFRFAPDAEPLFREAARRLGLD